MSDLIRREDAIDAALTFLVEYCGAAFDEDMQKMLCERFDALPSAEPTHGKWIGVGDHPYEEYECSSCGQDPCDLGDMSTWKYCPECGARMDG